MNEASRISLRDIDIVVSYRETNEERRENLYTVLQHLARSYTDYRLWLVEADTRPRFDWSRVADPATRHVFIPYDGPFPKARLCNAGARLSQSPVVCFHDADSIAAPATLRASVDALLDGNASDALCPYWTVVNVAGALKQAFVERPEHAVLGALDPENLPPDANVLYARANGGIVLFRRADYLRVGGYNVHLEGWGGEDDELFWRATRLGVRWHSFHSPLIHLHHDTASRSDWAAATRDGENIRASVESAEMPQAELVALAAALARQFD
jgi:hypothetical protein